MNKLLILKHWHIFGLVFGLQFVYKLTNLLLSFELSTYIKYEPIIILVTGVVFFSWLWIVAISLNQKLGSEIYNAFTKFRVSFIYTISYLILVSSYSIFIRVPSSSLIIYFHILAILALLYCLAFVAKTLKMIELNRQVKLSEYLGDFLLIFLFPIGIWVIQPRINSLFK